MMRNKSFVALILTNRRADKVKTIKALQKSGYTGDIKLVIDNEDPTGEEYVRRYGRSNVIVFDKKAEAMECDTADNSEDRRVILFARNVAFKIARELGYKYFIELDDDYSNFSFRKDGDGVYKSKTIRNIDAIFDAMIDFYECDKRIKSVAMAQNGDFVGGKDNPRAKVLSLGRKCMNSFVCSTDPERGFKFFGRINEDVNVYTKLGNTGDIFFTIYQISLSQAQTQKTAGGMTSVYIDGGTYIKSFYSVMYMPSAVSVAEMGSKHRRIHHRVSWNNAVPKIISEAWKK